MDIREDRSSEEYLKKFWRNNKDKILIRPILHAPEIDPYDEISFDQIVLVYNATGEIDIGEKVVYRL
jgi:hypothetical protein